MRGQAGICTGLPAPSNLKNMEQELYGVSGYDEIPDEPCKAEMCTAYNYEDGLCETHFMKQGLTTDLIEEYV